jgi:hypothetical protein
MGWPRSTNPHLFITRRTALHADGPAMNKFTLLAQFRKIGVTPSQLWTDRILDEAIHTRRPGPPHACLRHQQGHRGQVRRGPPTPTSSRSTRPNHDL